MKFKADWEGYLQGIRKREISIIFRNCPTRKFQMGLEIGAGDGFQSILLSNYIVKLICTEYDPDKLKGHSVENVTYMVCDAERIDTYFKPNTFDIIFSSNLLEHLPQRKKALKSMRRILKDEGLMIHTMPNSLWKVSQIVFFYPNRFAEVLNLLTTKTGRDRILKRLFGYSRPKKNEKTTTWLNNPKRTLKNSTNFFLCPSVHGEYKNHFQEFVSCRKSGWLTLLNECGFSAIKSINLPVSSGYGFGLNRLRLLVERFGFSSTDAYVCHKKGKKSPYSVYWQNSQGWSCEKAAGCR